MKFFLVVYFTYNLLALVNEAVEWRGGPIPREIFFKTIFAGILVDAFYCIKGLVQKKGGC